VIVANLDIAATAFVNSFAGKWTWLDFIAIGFSKVGVVSMIAAVAARWWAKRDRLVERHASLVCGISFILGLGLNQVILLFIQRQRPYHAGVTHLLIPASADPSFPSDHATAGFAIVFAYLLLGYRGRALVFGTVALSISLSRIYLGTHYVSDIAGGITTALVAALVATELYRPGTPADRWFTGLL
jgi:undecaprenyl-diphosphatase